MIQYLITAVIDIVVGILALSKKENPAAKALALTVFSLGVWSLELYLLTVVSNVGLLGILFHITRWGMFFIPSTFAFFTWRLVGSRSRTFRNLVVLPGFFVSAALSLTNTFLFPSTLKEVEGGFLPGIDTVYYLFLANFIWCFLGSIGLVVASYNSSSYREKQRLKWLLITLFASFIGGSLGLYSMSTEFYLSRFTGSITNIVFVFLLFYATIQHNLMDFRFALSVGLSKAILLGFFIWLYFVVTTVVGDSSDSNGGIIFLLGFVALILEAYPRLLKIILPNAKKILVKNSYDFDQVKVDTEVDLKNSISFPMMLDVLDHLFLKTIKIHDYKILMVQQADTQLTENNLRPPAKSFDLISIDEELVAYCSSQTQLIMADEIPDDLQSDLKQHNASLCFSVFSENELLAIVLVGSPTNFSYYRYEDLKIFEWLQSELGQALSRIIRLNHMQDQLGEAKKTLSMLSLMNHYHHDIKVPFAIIDGVLSNDIYDREKQRDIVLEQVERGSRLIATMASILGGKHKRRIQPCALESLVQDCLFLFEKSFDNVAYELVGVPKIRGDAEDLKILFINLIKNAAEARRANSDLTLCIKSWIEDGNIFFSISDNGIGMSEQQLANLWDPAISTKKFGNGIGMQAIKRIVDEHHAHIEVKSNPSCGSEFILCFFASQIANEEASHQQTRDELAERRASYQVEKRNNH